MQENQLNYCIKIIMPNCFMMLDAAMHRNISNFIYLSLHFIFSHPPSVAPSS